VISAGVIATLGLLAATLPSVFDSGGVQAAATADALGVPAGAQPAEPRFAPTGSTPTAIGRNGRCPLVVKSSGYVNPLAGARVKPERIDQGVDYAGSGSLKAIGAAKVTFVSMGGNGWPGAFIEYRLLTGPDSGCDVYYAEGVSPAAGLHAGQIVRAGQAIAKIIPFWESGIEIGWGAGKSTETYAARMGQWNPRNDAEDIPTQAGQSFSALIASLGGPPGKVEGGPNAQRSPAPKRAAAARSRQRGPAHTLGRGLRPQG
jgi:hypothetical protein